MANILIVDDDSMVRESLVLQLVSMKHTSIVAETVAEGMSMLPLAPFDVVFLDVHLPDGDGLEVLPEFRNAPSKPEVIIITGEGSARSAELAINNGAWDYIQKPLAKQEIELQLTRALEYRASKLENAKPSLVPLKRSAIVGDSPELNARLDLVAQCAASDTNVLVTGETGTGKESFAQIIHSNSLAADNSFIIVDCAALPEQLVESTLFGHTRGAFTGADTDRVGLVKQADGGTLFLDEVGELSLSIQKKFLRVLQERSFKPVGSTREIRSKFRLISATNRNLDEMVAQGHFREDLLYRLRTFHIELPPLRTCKQDIRNLTLHYIDKLCRRLHLGTKGFAPEFMECLESHNWPGNVRELINTLEKAILADRDSPKLFSVHLPRRIRLQSITSSIATKRAEEAGEVSNAEDEDTDIISISESMFTPFPPIKQLREKVIEQVEREYLNKIMINANNDLNRVSDLSGLSKPRLYALFKKYSIELR